MPVGPPADEAALRERPLEPALSRLPTGTPRRAEILAAHASALAAGQNGYLDPATGLFTMSAQFLIDRGWCCQNGCRHCPYIAA